jgi:hypothetical protein
LVIVDQNFEDFANLVDCAFCVLNYVVWLIDF